MIPLNTNNSFHCLPCATFHMVMSYASASLHSTHEKTEAQGSQEVNVLLLTANLYITSFPITLYFQ